MDNNFELDGLKINYEIYNDRIDFKWKDGCDYSCVIHDKDLDIAKKKFKKTYLEFFRD